MERLRPLSASCSSFPSSLLDSGLSPFGIEAFSFGLIETATWEAFENAMRVRPTFWLYLTPEGPLQASSNKDEIQCSPAGVFTALASSAITIAPKCSSTVHVGKRMRFQQKGGEYRCKNVGSRYTVVMNNIQGCHET